MAVVATEGPGPEIVGDDVIALAVICVGVEDELGSFGERDRVAVRDPLLVLVMKRAQGSGRSGGLRGLSGEHGDLLIEGGGVPHLSDRRI